MRTDRWKLIQIPRAEGDLFELYDLVDDPGETKNLFAELAGYPQLPGSEQLRRKRMLKAQIAQALVQVPMAERVVQEIESGIAVAFLADAEAALATAIGLQAGAGKLALRIGLTLGTVHVVQDLNGQTAIVGEGVNDAQRVAAHAATGQALAAGSYREVVSRLSPDHAAVFRVVALRSDARGRFVLRGLARGAAGELVATSEAGLSGKNLLRPLEGGPLDLRGTVPSLKAGFAVKLN